MARVKALGMLFDLHDMNIRWKALVEGILDLIGGTRAGGSQVGDLRQCMDSRVGPSRSSKVDLCSKIVRGG